MYMFVLCLNSAVRWNSFLSMPTLMVNWAWNERINSVYRTQQTGLRIQHQMRMYSYISHSHIKLSHMLLYVPQFHLFLEHFRQHFIYFLWLWWCFCSVAHCSLTFLFSVISFSFIWLCVCVSIFRIVFHLVCVHLLRFAPTLSNSSTWLDIEFNFKSQPKWYMITFFLKYNIQNIIKFDRFFFASSFLCKHNARANSCRILNRCRRGTWNSLHICISEQAIMLIGTWYVNTSGTHESLRRTIEQVFAQRFGNSRVCQILIRNPLWTYFPVLKFATEK